MRSKKPILLIEDDQVDAMTVNRALKDLMVCNELIRKENGEEALEFLRNENNLKPCIILLDLNMPRMNGIEFLNVAKNDAQLKMIPVIVLTTSHEEWDRIQSFNLGAAGYMVKPVDYKQFVEVVRVIDLYWTLSELPA
ncbi:MAG: two-component system response regulator [Firmicutes bacterium HGW-Firmicutes-15]|nr:MAG: two-component system response regulator [Firmicutes bacterium HGW-Firmicutes-15]